MKRTFKIENVTCINCVNLIKTSLEDQFTDIEINLDANPKELSVTINSDDEKNLLKRELEYLGFPIIQ